MDYYVYIIQSTTRCLYYKGYTSHPLLRLEEHNQGLSRYTSGKGPWQMVYLEKLMDKTSALKREKQLKRVNVAYIKWLVASELNILNEFLSEQSGNHKL